MTSAVASVLIASASSVAKVFLIATVGFLAVKRPKANPLIPPQSVGMLSRFAFIVLNIPLIYSAIGSTLTIEVLGSLWFVPFAGMVVIALSFVVATITERIPFFRVEHRVDFDALRIACSFPNVVAIPVLVFPSLCEFEVVYSQFIGTDEEGVEMMRNPIDECSNSLNAMTFSYFFAWIFMFYLMGNQMLVNAGKRKGVETTTPLHDLGGPDIETSGSEGSCNNNSGVEDGGDETNETMNAVSLEGAAETTKSATSSFLVAVKRSVLNPGSIAMWCGLITALIAPLQSALFSPGGALRFVGSAIESLADALPSMATIVTAASLIIPSDSEATPRSEEGDADDTDGSDRGGEIMSSWRCLFSCLKQDGVDAIYDPNYADIADNTRGAAETRVVEQEEEGPSPRRSSLSRMRRASARFGSQVKRHSLIIARSPTVRMHIWFDLTRLVITPAIVCGILIGIDCGTSVFDTIPHMAKLVVLLNSSLPSALLVILSLKSEGLSESASVVAKVYFPSYILSIFTIAGWASVGLILSIPDDDGKYFCER
mmetsp:Transcript_34901/g.70569  ORF Transcript_34901/g.70569 Transcript_34901/m.70569 type:complete len:542 (+) Transcript_34901:215-1840(+)